MKFKNSICKGEFFAKCLYLIDYFLVTGENKFEVDNKGWSLSEKYYASLEDAQKDHGIEAKWPAETFDNSLIYVPAKEELEGE